MVALHDVIDTIGVVMSTMPVTVRPTDSVEQAFEAMDLAGVAACPVTDEYGVLYGMVSRVDLLRALHPSRELRVQERAEVARLPVREVMRCGVVTVEPGDPLVAAVDLFVDTRLHALPVVSRGSGRPMVVGIVTQGDALRHLMRGAAERS